MQCLQDIQHSRGTLFLFFMPNVLSSIFLAAAAARSLSALGAMGRDVRSLSLAPPSRGRGRVGSVQAYTHSWGGSPILPRPSGLCRHHGRLLQLSQRGESAAQVGYPITMLARAARLSRAAMPRGALLAQARAPSLLAQRTLPLARSFCSAGTIEVPIPELGAESISEGGILSIAKSVGDYVAAEELVAEIETGVLLASFFALRHRGHTS